LEFENLIGFFVYGLYEYNSCGVAWNSRLDNLVSLVFVAQSFILGLTIPMVFNIEGMATFASSQRE